MKAMILAAGKGERMQPLTASTPKPLLVVKGKTLIEHRIDALREAGITQLVINVFYLGEQIMELLGDGSNHGVSIEWSEETALLNTGGGIHKALPLLCRDSESFVVVNADIWCDYDFSSLSNYRLAGKLAHLVLVENPDHNASGDFVLDEAGQVNTINTGVSGLTFSGISVLNKHLFENYKPTAEAFPLKDVLLQAMENNAVSGELFHGQWNDVGTPERLKEVESL